MKNVIHIPCDCELCEKVENTLRLLKSEFNYYDVAFKKHKDIDDFKIAQVLSKLLGGLNKDE